MKRLYTNAVIYSPNKLRADTIAVDNGRIIEIGNKSKLDSLKRHGFKVINLKGKTVFPGFIDSHLHLLSTGYGLLSVDLSNIDSLEKVLAKIEKAAKKHPAGQWLIGRGWNKNLWGNDFPTKEMLDKISPRNPALFFAKDGHTIWVNSLAIKAASVDEHTPDPEGGRIKRDSSGEATGVFMENAVELISNKIPEASTEFKLKAIKKASAYFNSLGITGVGDCDWNPGRLGLFDIARKRGFLNLRVFMMLSPDDISSAKTLGLHTGFGDDFITTGMLKLYMDGALGSQTAWMFEPYENSDHGCGVPTLSEDQLESYFERTHLEGISMAVHAIGDRAIAELLDFFGKKYKISKKLGLKHRIEHAQHMRKEDIARFKKYDVAVAVQPIHAMSDRDMSEKYIGKRSRWTYPFATMLKRGAKLGFGSDCPIEDPNPLMGIYAAIARKSPADKRGPWYKEECVTLAQAITGYTTGAAEICSWGGKCGDIAPGMKADFVVLSDDLYKIDTEQIPKVKVLATIVNGEIVYQNKAMKI